MDHGAWGSSDCHLHHSAHLQGCNLQDGWCTTSPSLHLTAAEPVAGQSITIIEGTRNGEPFACPGAVCDVPLLQGGNDFTYWALSTWGDSSQMGTYSARVDSVGPTIDIPDTWYIWEPLDIQYDDDGSGAAKISLTIEGGDYGDRSYRWKRGNAPDNFIWDRRFGEVIAPIGEYAVTVEAWDSLGNKSKALGEIVIPDPGPPPDSAGTLATTLAADSAPLSSGAVSESEDWELALLDPTPAQLAAMVGGEGEAPRGSGSGSPDQGDLVLSVSSAPQSQPSTAVPPTSTGILWGAAAVTLGTAATAYTLRRRQVLRQQPTGTTEPTQAGLPDLGDEDGWPGGLLEFLSGISSGARDVVDGVIELTHEADGVSAATALRRLFNPSMSPSVYAEMTEYIWDLFRQNPHFSDADALLGRMNEWAPANRRAYPVNLRDLQDFLNAIRSEDAIVSGNGAIALLLILAGGKLAVSHPWEGNLLQKLGGSLGSAGDVWQGARLLTDSAKYAEYAQLLNTPWGAVTSGFTGGAGLLQFAWNWNRLATDPTISDLASNERWGVALQSLGGGLLMVGGAAGFAIALSLGTGAILAALPVLVPIGLVLGGVGWVVENWDWIGSGLAAWPGVIEMGGTIVKKTVVEPITHGARAWSGIVDNGREIARALPRYVNEQINETVIQPLASRLGTLPGIIHNAGEIARAAPGYLRDTVIEPAVSAVRERVVEPVSRGLSAWGGVVDNGRTIIQAAPRYLNDRVIQPAIRTTTESIVRPAVQAISQRIVQPVQNTLSRAASAIKSIFGG